MNSAALNTNPQSPEFFARARANMIESQLRPNRILDERLLKAFADLPRENFAAAEARDFAYIDEDIAMGPGRKMLAPLPLARLVQDLDLAPSARALVVGAGTGYGAAVVNELAGEVVALESDPALFRKLQQAKQDLQMDNVTTVQSALVDGFAPAAPYQAILLEGAIQWLPEKIGHQLAEGGKIACIVYPEGTNFGRMGRAMIYERRHGVLSEKHLFDVAAPLLPGFTSRPRFVFQG